MVETYPFCIIESEVNKIQKHYEVEIDLTTKWKQDEFFFPNESFNYHIYPSLVQIR